ncbi:MAG: hypothetical protein CYPHOPRED_004934 [Cyphobasidiales sp. Tagirdzhanova-0007]|nr:MAG: hypothetical protein CYPHOPRED_004934 [Cyphobasidiales sp. Tagirdzhanova-0007]
MLSAYLSAHLGPVRMAAEARLEELEVLESILDKDFERISDEEVTVRVEPEEGSTSEPMLLLLRIRYTPNYPDELPDMSIDVQEEGAEEDQLTEEDRDMLLRRLRESGEENIGIAMVYTLVLQLKESLTELLIAKAAARELEDQVEALKAELAKPKGTPVTAANFLAWKKNFEVEMLNKRTAEQADDLRLMPPKERRDREAFFQRVTGRQIFESKKLNPDEEHLEDEDAQLVDISKYSREEVHDDEEEKEQGLVLSDSE